MATRRDSDKIFQCSKCEKMLEMDSMTLPCLHSLCGRCFEEEFMGRKYENRHCPVCQEFFIPSQLTLSPFLVNSLKHRQHYGSTKRKCDDCLDEARFGCKDCDQVFCFDCFWEHYFTPTSDFVSQSFNDEITFIKKGKVMKLIYETTPTSYDFIFNCLQSEIKKGKVMKLNYETTPTFDDFIFNCLQSEIKKGKVMKLKCDQCFERGIDSLAKISCKDCNKNFCDECNWHHNSILTNLKIEHNSRKLGIEDKFKQRTDLCNEHEEVEEFYCERCNMCFCNTCYNTHLKESPQCPSHPISVWDEAVKKKKSQCPTLYKEIDEFKINLERKKRVSQFFCEQLEMNCHKKCKEIWQNFEEIVEELRNKTIDLCDEEVRFIKDEQVKKCRELMDENDRILKKLDNLFLYLHHFSEKNEKDKNEMICGVRFVANKLESLSTQFQQIEPIRKCILKLNYSDFWQKFLEKLKNEKIASGYLNYSDKSIELETEFKLNTYCWINSFVVSEKDSHIFIVDGYNKSIIEFTELGEKVCEFFLIEGGKKFIPTEIILTSSEVLVVNCLFEKKLFFLKRNNFSPFLEIEKIIETKKYFSSICKMKKTILICDYKFQLDFYTENGEYIKTINTWESAKGGYDNLIRADPSNGNFWGVDRGTCEIFLFDENLKKLKTFEPEEKIFNFFINDFGDFYFCNFDGIFSFFPEKKLHQFQKKISEIPCIFVSNEKIFVSLRIDGEWFIKIFKIVY